MKYKCPKCGCDELCISTENAATPFDWDYRCNNCGNIFPMEEAVKVDDRPLFDRITESPETLADKLVFWMSLHKADGTVEWYAVSTVAKGKWNTRAEALAATIEKLKEVTE